MTKIIILSILVRAIPVAALLIAVTWFDKQSD